MQLNAGLNLIVLIIYWGAIHEHEIDKFEGMQRAHMYWVHLMPQFAYFLDFCCTDLRLVSWHGIYLFAPLAIVYSMFNFVFSMYRGAPLYWFMTWKDMTS